MGYGDFDSRMGRREVMRIIKRVTPNQSTTPLHIRATVSLITVSRRSPSFAALVRYRGDYRGKVEEEETETPIMDRVKEVVDNEDLISDLEAEFSRLTTLISELEEKSGPMETELSKLQEQSLRLNADFDNFRKRTVREKEQLANSSKSAVLEELLPVIDAFDLSAGQLKIETEGEQKVADSYQGLYKQMMEIFEKIGLKNVPGVGSPFDPNLHDAIMREETTEMEDGAVLEEFRKGFMFGDTLIRASMVKVAVNDSAPPAKPAEEEEASSAATSNKPEVTTQRRRDVRLDFDEAYKALCPQVKEMLRDYNKSGLERLLWFVESVLSVEDTLAREWKDVLEEWVATMQRLQGVGLDILVAHTQIEGIETGDREGVLANWKRVNFFGSRLLKNVAYEITQHASNASYYTSIAPLTTLLTGTHLVQIPYGGEAPRGVPGQLLPPMVPGTHMPTPAIELDAAEVLFEVVVAVVEHELDCSPVSPESSLNMFAAVPLQELRGALASLQPFDQLRKEVMKLTACVLDSMRVAQMRAAGRTGPAVALPGAGVVARLRTLIARLTPQRV
eukprot:gene5013-6107_t